MEYSIIQIALVFVVTFIAAIDHFSPIIQSNFDQPIAHYKFFVFHSHIYGLFWFSLIYGRSRTHRRNDCETIPFFCLNKRLACPRQAIKI